MSQGKVNKLDAARLKARFGGFRDVFSGVWDFFTEVVTRAEVQEAAKELLHELVQALLSTNFKANPKKFTAFEERAGKLGLDWSKLLQLAQLIANLLKDRNAA